MSDIDSTSLPARFPLWTFLCGVAWGYLLAAMSDSRAISVALGILYVAVCATWWALDFAYRRGAASRKHRASLGTET